MRLKCQPFVCWLMISLSIPARAADEISVDLVPPRLEAAIDRGLSFLQQHQNADGSFGEGAWRTGETGLALLAFLSAGHTSEIGPYGQTVRKAIDYVVRLNPAGGYFGSEGGMMY